METETLGNALPKAMARAREIQANAREIGPPGSFLVAIIELKLRAAEHAMAEGDLSAMIRAYQALADLKE